MLEQIIPSQNYESIRDAIGRVLTAEIAAQDALITQWNLDHKDDEGFVAKQTIGAAVWLERYNPFDKAELPALNIVYTESQQLSESSPFSTVFDNKFLIECYTHSEQIGNTEGGKTAALKLAMILGKVRAILMTDTNYYLDFEEKFIQGRRVQTIARTAPRINNDAYSSISGTIEAHYIAEETTELATGVPIGELETVVKISDTEKGYKFIIQ